MLWPENKTLQQKKKNQRTLKYVDGYIKLIGNNGHSIEGITQ